MGDAELVGHFTISLRVARCLLMPKSVTQRGVPVSQVPSFAYQLAGALADVT